jgi:hypothetical protein
LKADAPVDTAIAITSGTAVNLIRDAIEWTTYWLQ